MATVRDKITAKINQVPVDTLEPLRDKIRAELPKQGDRDVRMVLIFSLNDINRRLLAGQ